MTVPHSSTGLPPARADDDDDVAWALQTAQVQWQRGAHADAVVWLRRAVESARGIGALARAAELERATHSIVERLMDVSYGASQPPAPAPEPVSSMRSDVDDLLDAVDDGAEDIPIESAQPISIDEEIEDVQVEEADAEEIAEPESETSEYAAGQRPDLQSIEEIEESDAIEEISDDAIDEVEGESEFFEVHTKNLVDIGLGPGEGLDERTTVDAPRSSRDFDDLDYDDEENPTRPARSVDAAISFSSEVTPMSTSRVHAESNEAPLSPRVEALRAARARVAQAAQRAAQFAPVPVPQARRAELSSTDELHEDTPLYVPRSERPPNYPVPSSVSSEQRAALETPAEVQEPEPERESVPPASAEVPASSAPPPDPRIDDVLLSEVRGLEDLPPEAQLELAHKARKRVLDAEEEVSGFALALVLCGSATVMPTIADVACAQVPAKSVVFSRGHLASGVALRVVAAENGTEIALWNSDALDAAIADCPWVDDDLRTVADRYQALAGVAMGPLGDRLDDFMRSMVTDRCEVRLLLPEEEIVTRGKPVPGMFIVGGGNIEIFGEDDVTPTETLGPGDFVLPAQILAGGKAQGPARAGKNGALVLFAERLVAHELLVSVPPLLEVFAS